MKLPPIDPAKAASNLALLLAVIDFRIAAENDLWRRHVIEMHSAAWHQEWKLRVS